MVKIKEQQDIQQQYPDKNQTKKYKRVRRHQVEAYGTQKLRDLFENQNQNLFIERKPSKQIIPTILIEQTNTQKSNVNVLKKLLDKQISSANELLDAVNKKAQEAV